MHHGTRSNCFVLFLNKTKHINQDTVLCLTNDHLKPDNVPLSAQKKAHR